MLTALGRAAYLFVIELVFKLGDGWVVAIAAKAFLSTCWFEVPMYRKRLGSSNYIHTLYADVPKAVLVK